jgi:hypothetical protein
MMKSWRLRRPFAGLPLTDGTSLYRYQCKMEQRTIELTMHGRCHERAGDLKNYGAVEQIAELPLLRGVQPAYAETASERSLETLNDLHAAAAARARRSLVVRRIRIIVIIRGPIRWRRWHIE